MDEYRIRITCQARDHLREIRRYIEHQLRKRASRRRNSLKQEWKKNYKGNWVLRYIGEQITAIERNGNYGIVYQNRWVWEYKGRKIRDLDTMKLAAFEGFDYKHDGPEDPTVSKTI